MPANSKNHPRAEIGGVDLKEEEIEVIDGGECEILPGPPPPDVETITTEELPQSAVPAPPPEELFMSGYFQKGGRPGPGVKRKYETREQLIEAIDKYFARCYAAVVDPETGKTAYRWVEAPTTPGLARALGFKSRSSLTNYGNRDEFSDIIASAKLVIEDYLAKAVSEQSGNQSGKIFALKNMGWSDMQTVRHEMPNRLQDAKSVEEIAAVIEGDIVLD